VRSLWRDDDANCNDYCTEGVKGDESRFIKSGRKDSAGRVAARLETRSAAAILMVEVLRLVLVIFVCMDDGFSSLMGDAVLIVGGWASRSVRRFIISV
jgi:hypothetical protein